MGSGERTMKIWSIIEGAIEHCGVRIQYDEIHENHYYVLFKDGGIVATLHKRDNLIKGINKPIPKRIYPMCECNYCKGGRNNV